MNFPETFLAEARKHGLKPDEESAFLMWVANECFEKREVSSIMVLEARSRELVLMFHNERRPK
jgi:hypothetical protein